MQWLNLPICSLFFNIVSLACGPHTSSIGVAAFGFLWYRSSHSDPWKNPQLQIWWSDTASLPSVFFSILGNRKPSDYAKSGEYGGWSTSSEPQSHTAAIATTDLCADVLMKQDSLCQFSRLFCIVYSTTLQSPVLLIQCGIIWKETMQLVSGKVEFNACQVALLWHNSFLCHGHTFA